MRVILDGLKMPWKNGGGVTWELWREPAAPAAFNLRISSAEVAADGPFSRFDGVDRWITLVSGAGFDFVGPAGRHRCREVGAIVAFDGGEPWDCMLVDGPVRDLNVMVRRGAGLRVEVRRVGPGPVPVGMLFTLAPLHLGGLSLPAGALVVVDAPSEVDGDAVVIVVERAVEGAARA